VGRFRHARGRLADALAYIARHGVVRLILMEKQGPGRNPSPRWQVNPALYDHAQNAQNAPNPPSEPPDDEDGEDSVHSVHHSGESETDPEAEEGLWIG
jgi:hypothetical protein